MYSRQVSRSNRALRRRLRRSRCMRLGDIRLASEAGTSWNSRGRGTGSLVDCMTSLLTQTSPRPAFEPQRRIGLSRDLSRTGWLSQLAALLIRRPGMHRAQGAEHPPNIDPHRTRGPVGCSWSNWWRRPGDASHRAPAPSAGIPARPRTGRRRERPVLARDLCAVASAARWADPMADGSDIGRPQRSLPSTARPRLHSTVCLPSREDKIPRSTAQSTDQSLLIFYSAVTPFRGCRSCHSRSVTRATPRVRCRR